MMKMNSKMLFGQTSLKTLATISRTESMLPLNRITLLLQLTIPRFLMIHPLQTKQSKLMLNVIIIISQSTESILHRLLPYHLLNAKHLSPLQYLLLLCRSCGSPTCTVNYREPTSPCPLPTPLRGKPMFLKEMTLTEWMYSVSTIHKLILV